jgi:hypothetical protein
MLRTVILVGDMGLDFFVAHEFLTSVSSATTISNRIALLRVMLRPNDKSNKSGRQLVFVNCYAPHSWMVKEHPELAEEFYLELNSIIKLLKKEKAIVIVGGDLGIDKIEAELLKYGGEAVARELTFMMNDMFVQSAIIPHLCEGMLVPLNKPGKEKVVENTRPITLLTIIRKVLSRILLWRIQDFFKKFVRHYQCGFLEGRGTGEIIEAYRWL